MSDDPEDDWPDPERFYFTVWFAGNGESEDILVQLYRDRGKVILSTRLRIYDPTDPDNEPWSGKDYKKWVDAAIKDEPEAIRGAQKAMENVLDAYIAANWERVAVREKLPIYGKGDVLAAKLFARPWASARTGTKEEIEAIMKKMARKDA